MCFLRIPIGNPFQTVHVTIKMGRIKRRGHPMWVGVGVWLWGVVTLRTMGMHARTAHPWAPT